jgi:hypothetical protein
MAITENTDFPVLTPPEDRMPSGSRLFRRPEELSDEQFDLLAAAWSEDALAGEALAELESVFSVSPERRNRAESFRQVRLTPLNESWQGMHSSLRNIPELSVFRRTVIPALLAVAAMVILFIYGPAGAKLKKINNEGTSATPAMTVAEIPASSPLIRVTAVPEINTVAVVTSLPPADVFITGPEITTDIVRVQPLALAYGNAEVSPVAPSVIQGLAAVSLKNIQQPAETNDANNWILRSVSYLASAVTGKEKRIDGYAIASGAVSGINTILGWQMELEQVNNKKGDPVAVSFSSSLLSFTKPMNKSTP